jgi:hypothetical protein
MARYLYRCADGVPCYYLDEDGGGEGEHAPRV